MKKKQVTIKKLHEMTRKQPKKTATPKETPTATTEKNKTDLQHRTEELKKSFNNTFDLIFNEIKFGNNNENSMNIIFLNTITDTALLNQSIVSPLIQHLNSKDLQISENFVSDIVNKSLAVSNYEITTDLIYVQQSMVSGNVILMFDGFEEVIIIPNAMWKEKAIGEPTVERSFFGIGISFTEHAETNINVLRGLLKSEHLTIDKHKIGDNSKSEIYVIHMNDIVDRKILNQVNERISKIDLKYVLDIRILSLYLQGKKTLFPLILKTDRPDTVASNLLQGKVIVMLDGNPFPLTLPSLFFDFFHSPSDYEDNYTRFSGRIVRILNYLLTILLPAIYVAFVKLDIPNLPKGIEKAFMPKEEIINTFWQLTILAWMVRTLIDGAMRLSSSAVILVTMLGTVVVGENLVSTGIIHPFSLIVTALTFVTASAVGNKGLQASFVALRYLSMLVAYFWGFTGIIIGMTMVFIYMVSLKSFGTPYMSPLIPLKPKEMKDTFARGNLKKIINSKHKY